MKYDSFIKWWLTGILFYFPFLKVLHVILQKGEHNVLLSIVQYLDEVTIIVCFLIAIRILFRDKKLFSPLYLLMGIPIIAFSLSAWMSGIVNGNPMFITALGVFDYIKYFLLVFIYAAFMKDISAFKKIYKLMLILGIALCLVAIVEETWAVAFRYIAGRDVMDPFIYLFRDPPPNRDMSQGIWRFGLLRTSSFILKIDWLGYLCLLILTLYVSMSKKIISFVSVTLIIGILLTVSKSSYAGLFSVLILIILLRKFKAGKRVMAFISMSMIVAIILVTSFVDFGKLGIEGKNALTYREYARDKCLRIWSDYPLFGAGPGRFGGIVSIRYKSPLYEEYNYNMYLLKRIGGIDQFWPQLLAETGIIGFVLFIGILLSLIKLLFILRKQSTDMDYQGYISGLIIFLMVIFIFSFGTGFNTTAIIFPYFAFIGIALGIAGMKETE